MNAKQLLHEKFGFPNFRPGQEEIITDVMNGKDVLAILPTGMGKSLCYQLPAYAMPGSVLIISPLIALMEDQVANMKRSGEKRVAALNSFLTYTEKRAVIEHLDQYKFIFISPEMLMQPFFIQTLQSLPLSLIAVDEAHCISQWGFDFRPDYLRIGELFTSGNRPNILALTATADSKVSEDIIQYLHLKSPLVHRQSIDRNNISYSISKMKNDRAKTVWLKEHVKETTGPGIIYVSSRRRADELARILQEEGQAAASYHAGKDQEDRAFIQDQFINGDIMWICATNAFGMGIHKKDIRQVIHEHLPQSLAGYVQEVGRAGRDGEPSLATLLYAPDDEMKMRYIMLEDLPQPEDVRLYVSLRKAGAELVEAREKSGISETGQRVIHYYLEKMSTEETISQLETIKNEKEKGLQQIVKLAASEQCIRKVILHSFDEHYKEDTVNCCSVCGIGKMEWLFDNKRSSHLQEILPWEERLAKLLG